jgi:hypothetical protein
MTLFSELEDSIHVPNEKRRRPRYSQIPSWPRRQLLTPIQPMRDLVSAEPAKQIIEFELEKETEIAPTSLLARPAQPPIQPLNSSHGSGRKNFYSNQVN